MGQDRECRKLREKWETEEKRKRNWEGRRK